MLPRSPIVRVLLVLLALGLGWLAVDRAVREDNDFDGFHRAAASVLHDGVLSGEKSVERYLPAFSVLLAPLGALPLGVAAGLWYLLSLAALLGLPRQLEALTGATPREQRPAFLVMLPLIVDNLALGQSGPLLLWLAVAGAARCRRGLAATGGALLGLAATLKVLPAILLALPVVLGRGRRALAGAGLALLAVAGLCLLALGPAGSAAGLADWSAEVQDQTPERLVALDRSLRHGNQSLWISLWRTLGDTSAVRSRDWPKAAHLPSIVVWTLAAAVLAGLAALGLRAAAAARRLGDDAWERLCALVCLALLFVSPLVWTHYFLWMLPAVLALRNRPAVVRWGGLCFVLALASPDLRSLGVHQAAAVAAFVLVARDLLRSAPPLGNSQGVAGGSGPLS